MGCFRSFSLLVDCFSWSWVDVGQVNFLMAFRWNGVDDWVVCNLPLSKFSLSDVLDPDFVSRYSIRTFSASMSSYCILVACSVCCGLGGSSRDINISWIRFRFSWCHAKSELYQAVIDLGSRWNIHCLPPYFWILEAFSFQIRMFSPGFHTGFTQGPVIILILDVRYHSLECVMHV